MPTEIVTLSRPDEVDGALRASITRCWVEVTNAGGAVGFPFPPVSDADVSPAVAELVASLGPASRLIVATIDGTLAGWVSVTGNRSPVAAHWATVQRLQTALEFRGRGVGRALMQHARTVARDELHVDQLWLAVRGGMGLEDFYRALGWTETGRHPGALRLATDDVRDEVFMVLPHL
jgi:GNAT superfamily N-acetyltransferase